MKNTRFTKLLSLAAACLILIVCVLGISISAEEAETAATLEIDKGNIVFNDKLQLAFTLKGTAPAGAKVGIIEWAIGEENPTLENAARINFTSQVSDGVTYYTTLGIAASEIDEKILVAACYKLDGETVIAETPVPYSLVNYAGKRIAADELTAAQAQLYESIINYSMASNEVFDKSANYACVKTVGGTIGSYGVKIGGWAGHDVLLRAEAMNSDGEYFVAWQNANGEVISTDRLATVACPNEGIDTYTAVYGDAADSNYAYTIGFEGLEYGQIMPKHFSLYYSPNQIAYNTKYDNKYWIPEYKISDNSVVINSPIAAVIDDSKNPIRNTHTGLYEVRLANEFHVTRSLAGDKDLTIKWAIYGRGYNVHFTKPAAATGVTAIEYDISYLNRAYSGIGQFFMINVTDKDGTTVGFRINNERSCKNQTLKIYDEAKSRVAAGEEFYLADNTVATIRCELDFENAEIDIYVDCVYIGSLKVEHFSAYQDKAGTFVFEEGCYISSSYFSTPSGTMCDVTIDNATYFAAK